MQKFKRKAVSIALSPVSYTHLQDCTMRMERFSMQELSLGLAALQVMHSAAQDTMIMDIFPESYVHRITARLRLRV